MELPINKLKITRYENIFPDLNKKDFDALKKSIEKWGIIEPIVLNQHNVIICGKERYRAALELGLERAPVVIRITNGDYEIENILIEENLRRKHLTSKKTRRIQTFHESNGKMSKSETGRKKRKYLNSRKGVKKQSNIYEQKIPRNINSAKIIPEIYELLDDEKTNQEVACSIQKCLMKIRRRHIVF